METWAQVPLPQGQLCACFVPVHLGVPGSQAGRWVGGRRAFQPLMGECSPMDAGEPWFSLSLLFGKHTQFCCHIRITVHLPLTVSHLLRN